MVKARASGALHSVVTFGGRVQDRWRLGAEVTVFGPAAFLIEGLKTSGLWERWVARHRYVAEPPAWRP
jgi:hypothetical protein